jgi:hypothetical protein
MEEAMNEARVQIEQVAELVLNAMRKVRCAVRWRLHGREKL